MATETLVTLCQGCPLSDVQARAVGSRGNPAAPLIIVGEAPGRDELRKGVPFIGRAGQLLTSVADRVGLSLEPEDCFITNAIRCLPADGPQPEYIESCRPRLLEELPNELTRGPRKLVVALGNTALRSITGNNKLKITQERGRIIDTEYGPVLPILHPAAVLRNPGEMRTFQADLAYAALLLEDPNHRKAPGLPEYKIATQKDIHEWVNFLAQQPLLAADIETTGFNAFKDRILCLGVCWAKHKVVIIPGSLLGECKSLFALPQLKWVWHNGKFDTTFLQRADLPARVDEDTMLGHYALDERRGTHDLKQLARNFLGSDDYDAELRSYLPNRKTSFEVIPEPILHQYLAYDCDATWQIWEQLEREITADSPANTLYRRVLLPASAFLQRVEQQGLYIDVPTLDVLEETYIRRHIAAYKQVQQAVKDVWDPEQYVLDTGAKKMPEEFNPGSSAQLKWVLFHKHALNLPVPKGYKMSTEKEVLEKLPTNRVTAAIKEIRTVDKTLSTYIDGFRERLGDAPDSRIHTTFLLHGTETGRLASRNPNLQNMPRLAEIRDMAQAPKGRRLVEVDLSQGELRMLAHLSQDPFLMDVYANGRDLHDEVAEDFFPGWSAQLDAILKKEQRVRAKFVNFGIAYGRGPDSIDKEFGCGIDEAKRYIRVWFQRAAAAHQFIQQCRQVASRGGTLRTPFGRKRQFSLVTKENLNRVQNEAANFVIQSMTSDITLLSAMAVEEDLKPYDAYVVNLVHDAILVELPDDDEASMAVYKLLKSTMEQMPIWTLNSNVPFVADGKMGKAWGSLKKIKD